MYSDDNIAQFTPDISKLVCFGLDSAPQMNTNGFVKNNGAQLKSAIQGGNQLFMRNKTQVLIQQNYESIKQAMLCGKQGASEANSMKEMMSFKGRQQAQTGAQAIRKAYTLFPTANKRQMPGSPTSDAAAEGKFIYKFKEGHSKNFKRELTADYFVLA